MGQFMELEEMLCDELDKITEKGELNPQSLEMVNKLSHSLKSLKTVDAMEKGGYSERRTYYDGGSYDDGGSSYARGRGRYAKRDSRGRYSNESYDEEYDRPRR